MTYSLPVTMSITNGINAIALAIAPYAENKKPVGSMMAVEGATALGHAPPQIAENSYNTAARGQALFGYSPLKTLCR